jgi:hypothetical protein
MLKDCSVQNLNVPSDPKSAHISGYFNPIPFLREKKIRSRRDTKAENNKKCFRTFLDFIRPYPIQKCMNDQHIHVHKVL